MRAPLSWLRDFAPFPEDVGVLRDALDDLGLVVEAMEHVGEGLEDVVVGRVLDIRPIKGADKIRLTVVDGGGPEPLEIAEYRDRLIDLTLEPEGLGELVRCLRPDRTR